MIVINDRYAIKSDERQWILCKTVKVSKRNPDGWDGFKYYTSLAALCESLRRILMRTSDYKSFADLTKNLVGINKLLEKKLRTPI